MGRSEFVSKQGYCDLVRITAGTLQGWINRHWKKGVQYVVIGHTTLIHVERADQWIKQHGRLGSGPAVTESESGSGERAGSHTPKRSRATRTQRVTSPLRCVAGQN